MEHHKQRLKINNNIYISYLPLLFLMLFFIFLFWNIMRTRINQNFKRVCSFCSNSRQKKIKTISLFLQRYFSLLNIQTKTDGYYEHIAP